MDNLRCTECGAQTETKCSCGKAYDYIPARDAAARAIAVHPDWSDVRLAEATGVSDSTIFRARKVSGSSKEEPEKRTGRDGKAQAARKSRRKNPAEKEAAAAALVLDRGLSYGEAAAETGVGSVQIVKTSVAREEGRREAHADPVIDPATLSKTAQEKLAGALRQHQRVLDAQFEFRVQSEIQHRVKELVMPSLQEQKDDAALVVRSRKGVFNPTEYNAILRCLHPDLNPSIEQKNEAFRLWHARKLTLMSEKDDPRQYRDLPTVEEFMASAKRTNRKTA